MYVDVDTEYDSSRLIFLIIEYKMFALGMWHDHRISI